MRLKKSMTKIAPVTAEALDGFNFPSGAILEQLAVVVQASPTNTDVVNVGTAERQDIELTASSGLTLFVIDTEEIYVRGNGSDSINILVSA